MLIQKPHLAVHARAVEKSTKPSYATRIDALLRPGSRTRHTVLDLFAGCGWLSLGFEAAGFKTAGMEMNGTYCDTYNANLHGRCSKLLITQNTDFPDADVVVGGPPCQPFSVFGDQCGEADKRNGVPAFTEAVRKVRPRLWMFENVRGVMYRSRAYFESAMEELGKALGYKAEYRLINMADHGVPQNRMRVIAVGHDGSFEFPARLPGLAVTAGEALADTARTHDAASKFLTPSMDRYVAEYERRSQCVNPRDLHLDRPARTVTCRNLAGATFDMHRILLPDGRRRRLTLRKAARLQGFPDWFEFAGTETTCFNQVGNAVPPVFARALAMQVRRCLIP